jgi:hypothetical protein
MIRINQEFKYVVDERRVTFPIVISVEPCCSVMSDNMLMESIYLEKSDKEYESILFKSFGPAFAFCPWCGAKIKRIFIF